MLGGVLVIEVGDERVEFCGRLLAQMGARVVKVEPPGGETTRRLRPLRRGDGGDRSLHFATANAGKESVVLDLTSVSGRDALDRMVDRAAMVLVGLDDPAELGVDADRVRRRNRAVVHVDISPFGRSGPYAGHRGTDAVAFALSGYANISGRRDGPPVVAPGMQAYVSAGAQAAVAAMVALREAERTGQGDAIEVAAMEALAAQENLYSTYSARGVVLTRDGSQHRACAPGRIYPCRDGFVHIFVGAQKERGVWDRWLEWIGRPAELADPRLQDIAVRKQPDNLARIDAVAEAFFADRTRAELVAEGQARHIPIVAVLDPSEALADAHVRERGIVVRVGDGVDAVAIPRPPWRSTAARSETGPAPSLGASTAAVLREMGTDPTSGITTPSDDHTRGSHG